MLQGGCHGNCNRQLLCQGDGQACCEEVKREFCQHPLHCLIADANTADADAADAKATDADAADATDSDADSVHDLCMCKLFLLLLLQMNYRLYQ